MEETIKVAAQRLRSIADQMQVWASTEDEEQVKREMLDRWKKSFMEMSKKNPRMKGRDLEQMWRDFQKCVTVDVQRILCASEEA